MCQLLLKTEETLVPRTHLSCIFQRDRKKNKNTENQAEKPWYYTRGMELQKPLNSYLEPTDPSYYPCTWDCTLPWPEILESGDAAPVTPLLRMPHRGLQYCLYHKLLKEGEVQVYWSHNLRNQDRPNPPQKKNKTKQIFLHSRTLKV